MKLIIEMFPIALMLSTPLIIAALGGLFSERSGIVNIALEACMSVGGFTAATLLVILSSKGVPNAVWIASVAAIFSGALLVSIHAFASIHMKADQTISGTALNVFAGGLTIYLSEIIFNAKSTEAYSTGATFSKMSIPILKEIPVIGKMFFEGIYPTTYIAFILVLVSWFILFKTPFGLRLRSCGEFPQASASMGINVVKMRWIGVLASGAFAGFAGAVLVLTTSTFYFAGSIHGLGFVAIATLIFGKWNPWGVLFAGIFFGFAQTLGLYSSAIPYLQKLPNEFFSLFPYVITIIVLVLFASKSVGPKASGEIYDSSKR
ncbi:ABC transporter permease [Erysipelotrichaceae bacterium OH741_COT-311]|nr:ABC transporter permease [Erysipelotrichaceae bacterium OH741_COT-311]